MNSWCYISGTTLTNSIFWLFPLIIIPFSSRTMFGFFRIWGFFIRVDTYNDFWTYIHLMSGTFEISYFRELGNVIFFHTSLNIFFCKLSNLLLWTSKTTLHLTILHTSYGWPIYCTVCACAYQNLYFFMYFNSLRISLNVLTRYVACIFHLSCL